MSDRLMPCPDCGGTMSKRASDCPHCGAKRKTAFGAVKTTFRAVVYVMFAIILAVVFFAAYNTTTVMRASGQ